MTLRSHVNLIPKRSKLQGAATHPHQLDNYPSFSLKTSSPSRNGPSRLLSFIFIATLIYLSLQCLVLGQIGSVHALEPNSDSLLLDSLPDANAPESSVLYISTPSPEETPLHVTEAELPETNCGLTTELPCRNLSSVFHYISSLDAMRQEMELHFLSPVQVDLEFISQYGGLFSKSEIRQNRKAPGRPASNIVTTSSFYCDFSFVQNVTITNFHLIFHSDVNMTSLDNLMFLNFGDNNAIFQNTTIHVLYSQLDLDQRVLRVSNLSVLEFTDSLLIEAPSHDTIQYDEFFPNAGILLDIAHIQQHLNFSTDVIAQKVKSYVGMRIYNAPRVQTQKLHCSDNFHNSGCFRLDWIYNLLTVDSISCTDNARVQFCFFLFHSSKVMVNHIEVHNSTSDRRSLMTIQGALSAYETPKSDTSLEISRAEASGNSAAQIFTFLHFLRTSISQFNILENTCEVACVHSVSTTLEAHDSVANNNTAGRGAFMFHSSGTVSNFTLTNHKGYQFGALLFTGERISVINSTFIGNEAKSGGGIQLASTEGIFTVDSCLFVENRADTGAAIASTLLHQLYVKNSQFRNNRAYNLGSAIFLECVLTMLSLSEITGSDFINNRVIPEKYAHFGNVKRGGSVAVLGRVTVDIISCQFKDQYSSFHAADILIDNVMSVDAISTQGSILKNVVIENPSSAYVGGSIFASGHIYMTNVQLQSSCSYKTCVPSTDLVHLEGGYSRFENCSFSNAKVRSSVVTLDTSITDIHDSTFERISSTGNGAALSIISSTVSIDNSKFSDLHCVSGGAIYSTGLTQLSLSETTFLRTETGENGGALSIHHSSSSLQDEYVVIESCTFSSALSGVYGGAIYVETGSLYFLGADNQIINSFSRYGGALYLSEQSTVFFGTNPMTGQNREDVPHLFEILGEDSHPSSPINNHTLTISGCGSTIGGGAIAMVCSVVIHGAPNSIRISDCFTDNLAPEVLSMNKEFPPNMQALNTTAFESTVQVRSLPVTIRMVKMKVGNEYTSQYIPGFPLTLYFELVDYYGNQITAYQPLTAQASVSKSEATFLLSAPSVNSEALESGFLSFSGLDMKVASATTSSVTVVISEPNLEIARTFSLVVRACPDGYTFSSGLCFECSKMCTGNSKCKNGQCQCIDDFVTVDSWCSHNVDTKRFEYLSLEESTNYLGGFFDRRSYSIVVFHSNGAFVMNPKTFRMERELLDLQIMNVRVSEALTTGETYILLNNSQIWMYESDELNYVTTGPWKSYVSFFSVSLIDATHIKIFSGEIFGAVNVYRMQRYCDPSDCEVVFLQRSGTKDGTGDALKFTDSGFFPPTTAASILVENLRGDDPSLFVASHMSVRRIRDINNSTMPVDTIISNLPFVSAELCIDNFDSDAPSSLIVVGTKAFRYELDTANLVWIAGSGKNSKNPGQSGVATLAELPTAHQVICTPRGILILTGEKKVSAIRYGGPCSLTSPDDISVDLTVALKSLSVAINPPPCNGGLLKIAYVVSVSFIRVGSYTTRKVNIETTKPTARFSVEEKYTDLMQINIEVSIKNRIGISTKMVRQIKDISCSPNLASKSVCSGNGVCTLGICKCDPGWTGRYCYTRATSNVRYFDALSGPRDDGNPCASSTNPCHNLQQALEYSNGDLVEYVGTSREISTCSPDPFVVIIDSVLDFNNATLVTSEGCPQPQDFLKVEASSLHLRNLFVENIAFGNGFISSTTLANVSMEHVHFFNCSSRSVFLSFSSTVNSIKECSFQNLMLGSQLLYQVFGELQLRDVLFRNIVIPQDKKIIKTIFTQQASHVFHNVVLHNATGMEFSLNRGVLMDNITCREGLYCVSCEGGTVEISNLYVGHMKERWHDDVFMYVDRIKLLFIGEADRVLMENITMEHNLLYESSLYLYSVERVQLRNVVARSNIRTGMKNNERDGIVRFLNVKELNLDGFICENHTVLLSGDVHLRGTCLTGVIDAYGDESQWIFSNLLMQGNSLQNYRKETFGGTIYIKSSEQGSVSFSNLTCRSNSASFGGCLFLETVDDVSIENARISDNIAHREGGAIILQSVNNYHIVSSEFVNNTALQGGSAISVKGYATVGVHERVSRFAECTFKHNQVKSLLFFSDQSGGRESTGGALYIDVENMQIELKNCEFLFNKAIGRGGDIYCGSLSFVPVVDECVFSNSQALLSGGSIFVSGGMVIRNCHFLGSSAESVLESSVGGVIHAKAADLTIQNCMISGGTATLGGALYCESSKCLLRKTDFYFSSASDEGGSIFVQYGTLDIEGSQFHYTSSSGSGGAISVESSSSLQIVNTIFKGNRAYRNGGAISIYESTVSRAISPALHNTTGSARIDLQKVTFENAVSQFGSAIYLSTVVPVYLSNVRIIASTARMGAVFLQDSVHMTVSELSFLSSHATVQGSALVLTNSSRVVDTNPIHFDKRDKDSQVADIFMLTPTKLTEEHLSFRDGNFSVTTMPYAIDISCRKNYGDFDDCSSGVSPNSEFHIIFTIVDAYGKALYGIEGTSVEIDIASDYVGSVMWRSTTERKLTYPSDQPSAVFTGLRVDGIIGSEFEFKITASLILSDQLTHELSGVLQTRMDHCGPGQYEDTVTYVHSSQEVLLKTCLECPEGQYSFSSTSTCTSCLDVEGTKSCKGETASVAVGYYASLDSDNKLQTFFCPKEQCQGATVNSSLLQNQCKRNHDGFLCASCKEGFSLFNDSCIWCKSFSIDSFLFYCASILLLTLYYHFTSTSEKNSAGVAIFVNFIQTLSICIKYRTWINRSVRFSSAIQNLSLVFEQILSFFSFTGVTFDSSNADDSKPWFPTMRCPYPRRGFMIPFTMVLQTLAPFFIVLVCFLFISCTRIIFSFLKRRRNSKGDSSNEKHAPQSLFDMELPLLNASGEDFLPEEAAYESDSTTDSNEKPSPVVQQQIDQSKSPSFRRTAEKDSPSATFEKENTPTSDEELSRGYIFWRYIARLASRIASLILSRVRYFLNLLVVPQAYTLTFCSLILYTYQPLAKTTLQYFNCYQLDEDTSVNVHFSSIRCDSGPYVWWEIFFFVPLLVYIILCPFILVSGLVVVHCLGILKKRTFKNWFGSLYSKYRDNRYFFEIVPMLRRFFLVGSTILADKFTLVGAAHLENLLFSLVIAGNIVLLIVFKPYRLKSDNYMEIFAFSSIVVMKAMEEGGVDSMARFVGMLSILTGSILIALFLLMWLIGRPLLKIVRSVPVRRITSSSSRLDVSALQGGDSSNTITEDDSETIQFKM